MRVLTIGTFDLLHEGHIKLFKRCAQLGDLFIGVNSDQFVERYKGVTPHDDENERLRECSRYGYSVLHRGRTEIFIGYLRPDYMVIGSDWARKDYLAQLGTTQDWLDGHDIALVYVPYTKGVSSTMLRASRDLARNLANADALEGHGEW